MNRRTSVLAGTLAGVLGGAIVGGSVLVGATASSTQSSQADATTAAAGRPCGALLSKLPDDLRQDLADAWKLPAGEPRLEALKKVRENARNGEYGATVERLAERRLERRGEIWKRLPADLRSDIKDLGSLSPEDRKATAEEIRKSALAGDYGDLVQQFAQHRQERREECRPGTTS